MAFCSASATRWRRSASWLKADEFIDRGDYLIVSYRLGGRARHTGLPVDLSFVNLFTFRDGKVAR